MIGSMLLAACGGDDTSTGEDTGSEEMADTVAIFSAVGEEQAAALEESMVSFEEATGIDVVVETSGDIWLDPARVSGGTTSILTVPFGDSPLGLFNPRSCFLHRQASFIVNFFPDDAVVGEDVDYFYLPPIDPAYGEPVLGSGSIMSQAVDNDAVRATMEYLTTGKSTEAEVKAGLFVSPHKDTPLDWYPDDVVRGFAEILQNADTFRFDGSDLMPGAVGAGTFWTGIVDWVGGAEIDSVLAAIDSSWPE